MKEENKKKLNARRWNDQELYLELGNVAKKHNLDDYQYIALEWLYNLTSKGTKMLKHGLDPVTTYPKLRKYLKLHCGVVIPTLSKQNAQKAEFVNHQYRSLIDKGLITFVGKYTHRNSRGYVQLNDLYEFTSEGLDTTLEKEDTYLKDEKPITRPSKLF